MVETANYKVIREEGSFEIRLYAEMIVASVKNSNEPHFNILFQYISGANKPRVKISMTSPVITTEKIAMTSPVISSPGSMSFIMPKKFDMETIPEPTDKRIKIKKIPERKIATVRFRGSTKDESVEKQTSRLLKWLETEGVDVSGSPFLMRYNPPYIPGFLRRNEIGVEINHVKND